MKREIVPADGYAAVRMHDNHIMAEPAASSFRALLRAPFTRRAWTELVYALATFPLATVAFVFVAGTLANGLLWAASAPGVRKLGAASRFYARALLGEDVPAPPRLRSRVSFRVQTPDAARLAAPVLAAGGKSRVWETKPGITVRRLPLARITALAAEAGITITDIRPQNAVLNWLEGRIYDPASWRARGYFALKLPLAAGGVTIAVGGWLGGLLCLTFPAWRTVSLEYLLPGAHIASFAASFVPLPAGAALLLVTPWLLHGFTEADRKLIRGLLGPSTPAERIRALEESRAHAVDNSAARLRGIERDLHDGTQAQLVALAMKLGLAREKLRDGDRLDLARAAQLVEDAHRGVIEAIADLRTLARGIHPPVLDTGLADALATLAHRSAVPVELVVNLPERPSPAIETIAYFSAAELLTNVAKHGAARHAALEAVHVAGLLRIRVTDDGAGGARQVPFGGLAGLAERVRTVDGSLEIDSPRGGPTSVTVELPSHA